VVVQFGETYLPGIPAWVQKAPLALLLLVARLAGIDKALARKYL
jgi:hypothetical protein